MTKINKSSEIDSLYVENSLNKALDGNLRRRARQVLNGDEDESAGTAKETAFRSPTRMRKLCENALTMLLSDSQMIRLGECILGAGIVILGLPVGSTGALVGLLLIGLGCAPIYPCIIHSTPAHFGADRSQALIGVQMASAYTGTCLMPPLFGLIANHIHVGLLPIFLLVLLALMAFLYQQLTRRCGVQSANL